MIRFQERHKTLSARDGSRLHYWIGRCGRPRAPLLVFLHGAASNHSRWSELLEMTFLTGSCDTLRPDLRGNGASMQRGRLDLEVWAADLRDILEREHRSTAILIGHSLGAQIALRFATESLDEAEALILLDPVFPSALRGNRRVMWKLQPGFALITRVIRLLNLLGIRRRSFPERDLRDLDRETRRELSQSGDPERLARKYSSLRLILPYLPTANYLQQLAATVAPISRPESIDLPVLILLAAGTSIADADALRCEIDRFPDSDVVPIEADHWPLTERPREVCEAIENWLVTRGLV